MEIVYTYTKKRCEFGRQPLFCEQGPELCDSLATAPKDHKDYILRNPVHQPTQHTPRYSEHTVNTIRSLCSRARSCATAWRRRPRTTRTTSCATPCTSPRSTRRATPSTPSTLSGLSAAGPGAVRQPGDGAQGPQGLHPAQPRAPAHAAHAALLRAHRQHYQVSLQQGPELCDSLATAPKDHKDYILRNPVHQPTQHTPRYSEHTVNTIRAEYSTTGANHAEGGWPKDVNILDPEATQRYRRKVEKDDPYIHCVMSLSPRMDHYILQNNAIDMYRTYYAEMAALPPVEKSSCRTVNVYRDAAGGGGARGRPVGSVSWQPDGGHCFAVTYADVDFYHAPRAPLDSYVWDVENANAPDVVLQPPAPLLDLQFNPRDGNALAGGLMSGQVGVWDRRRGGAPAITCAPHVAHRELVRSVLFINSKSGQEFFSGGPDGACKWWDIRNMSEPTDEMIIDVVKSSFDVQSMANANGISVMEYEPTIPTRFMVGTENGLVVGGNRKGKTPMEKLPATYDAHLGPVRSLERNPGFLKNFLTVGDWTIRVFSEECRESAVLWSPPLRHKITAATWSPTRLSLMLVLQWDGLLAAWDLLRRQHEPTLTMQVCPEPLLRVRMHDGGTMAACGSRAGNVYMVELSQSLAQSDKNDKALLTAMLERESKRERILETRMREIRLKQKQAEEASPVASVSSMEYAIGDRDLAEATTEYMAQVKKELLAM